MTGLTTIVEIDAELGESLWPGEAEAWSTVPYRLGDDAHKQAIKFSARPCVASAIGSAVHPGGDDHHLPADLRFADRRRQRQRAPALIVPSS